MIKIRFIFIALVLFLQHMFVFAQQSTTLNIPPREQWQIPSGYCGASSIQQAALYYGAYVSQDVCRKTIGDKEILVYINEDKVLDALGFTYEMWDYTQQSPQYINYLMWVKQHLYNKNPVLITVFVKYLKNSMYDHIMLATGFESKDVYAYNSTDKLFYNDCLSDSTISHAFDSIWSTRSRFTSEMGHDYAIPKNVNYGCAVTGIKDADQITMPVSLDVNSWNEPNVVVGEKAKMLHTTVHANELVPGTDYVLLRYNDYKNIPVKNFSSSTADEVIYFRAEQESQSFSDSVWSNKSVFYRCIPALALSLNSKINAAEVNVFPNPSNGQFCVEGNAILNIEIRSISGKILMMENDCLEKNNFDLSLHPPGIYIAIITCNEGIYTKKIMKN